MHAVYWLVAEKGSKTYVGCTSNLSRRIKEHREEKVLSTRNLGNFKVFVLEKDIPAKEVRKREKYWESCAGRRKLKLLFKNLAPSSNG